MGKKKLVRKAEPSKPPPEQRGQVEQKKSRWGLHFWEAIRIFAALIAVGTLLIVFRDYIGTLLYPPGLVVGTVTAVAAIVVLIRVGQRYEWTGFGESSHPKSDSQEIQPRKTLWDWLQLLIVPLALALIVVVWSAAQEGARLQELENQRAKAQRELAVQQAQDEALQAYLAVMKELLLEQDLRDSGPDSNARAVANVQTLLILEQVDPRRKTVVLRLLTDSHLIDAGAPLIETATLALQATDARGMDLSDTDLSRANLEGANLQGAILQGAKVADHQLSDTRSLQGATMPDGQKYEDWLKDKKPQGKDEKNE